MSVAKELFAAAGEFVKTEIAPDLGRMATLGQAEVANALFNGQAFTAYGEGQQSPEQCKDVSAVEAPSHGLPEQQIEMER